MVDHRLTGSAPGFEVEEVFNVRRLPTDAIEAQSKVARLVSAFDWIGRARIACVLLLAREGAGTTSTMAALT